MKRIALVVPVAAFILGYYALSNATADSDPCSITCYEKTPACYVSVDKSGCLDISTVKPAAKKGSYICSLKSCETKTIYNPESGAAPTTTVVPDTKK